MNVEEMGHVSGTWLNPADPAHAAILAEPLLAPHLVPLGKAHGGVLDLLKLTRDGRVAQIILLATRTDGRHDGIIRGTYNMLTAMAELMGNGGEELLALRDELVPDGLRSVNKSYRAEALQADELGKRLTPAMRARTDAITVGAGAAARPLTAYLDEWVALGKELGALEDERDRLLAGPPDPTTIVPSATKARNYWVKVVNAMLDAAELAELDEATMATIFAPYWAIERKADDRARQAAALAKQEAEKAAADKIAADKAAADKAAADKAAADKAGGGK